MRLLKITTFYPSYLQYYYHKHPTLAAKSFAEQKAALDYDAFGWADYWTNALTPLGYDVMELTYNIEPMQRAWAREHSIRDSDSIGLKEILIAQIKKFQPEILWFDDSDVNLLKQIRYEIPSIRLVLGWSGSAINKSNIWDSVDVIISCAPEAVSHYLKAGFKAAHLNHGFDPRINERLIERPKQNDFSFCGQLVRYSEFHVLREQMLEQLVMETGLSIYSPSADYTRTDDIKAFLLAGIYSSFQLLIKAGFPKSVLRATPIIGEATELHVRPVRPVNPKLKPFIKPAVFGLEMFQVLRDSKIVLNIHADSSPTHASNMRLFEITGVGACMVTDWKNNLSAMFEPDKEVIAYRSAEECIEKVKWLLDHHKEREEIAKAGMLRTFKEHTFSHRAAELDKIIKLSMN
jgi:spore maturation protein CgeB